MNTSQAPSFPSLLTSSGRAALQWRLLALWVITLLIPTALLTLPLWQIFSAQLNYSVHAEELAHSLNMNAVGDLISATMSNSYLLQQAGLGAFILTLLLTPFLNGAVVVAARSSSPLTSGQLIHGGISEYWRMFRLFLVALIAFGIAGGLSSIAMHLADKHAEQAILQSSAEFAANAALILLIILLVIADASIEAARAQFAHTTKRRSALKAWWAGIKMIIRRPLKTIGIYIIFTVLGLVLAGIVGVLRLKIPHVSGVSFIIGLLLTQLMVVCIAWMRIARLFALAAQSK